MAVDFDYVWSQCGSFGLSVDPSGIITEVTGSAPAVFEAPLDSILGTRWESWTVRLPMTALKSRSGKITRLATSWQHHEDGSMTGWCASAESEYAAKVQAERYADDLKQLEYAVSHDLMEPIRMVNGYLSMYMEESKSGTLNEDYLVNAQAAVTLTRKFLTDFVSYLRLDSQHRNSATLRLVNLNEIVQDVLRSIHLLVQEAGADIAVGTLPSVPGDGRMFYQIFSNLITNALKYRDPSRACKIVISSSESKISYKITVTDNGRGIHPSKIDRVFAPFVRGHKDVAGTGIGLAIVKRCLEYHDGRIRVTSAVGDGSVFTIELPKVRGQLETAFSPR